MVTDCILCLLEISFLLPFYEYLVKNNFIVYNYKGKETCYEDRIYIIT